jgi:hypothetical protein
MDRLRKKAGLVATGLGALWLAVQVGLFFFGPQGAGPTLHVGVRYGQDTPRYLEAARTILAGQLPSSFQLRYLGYDLFVAFFMWSGLGQLGIVLTQALLTSAAAYCLYRLACRLYDRRTGLFAAFFYIVYVDIHLWNFYILTDSLFTSLVIISLFLVIEGRGWWRRAVTVPVVIFTCTVRPHGVVLFYALGIYVLHRLWKARNYKAFAGVGCLFLIALPSAIELVNQLLAHSHPVKKYVSGHIIFGYAPNALTLRGTVPERLLRNENPLLESLLFFAAKPRYFLKLAGLKLWYFASHTRPYYSLLHNLFSLSSLALAYALAVWGLFTRTEYSSEIILLTSVCSLQAFAVALTIVSWDGRHLVAILPVVFLFAAHGAARLVTIKSRGL